MRQVAINETDKCTREIRRDAVAGEESYVTRHNN